jgi:hypothetical protein
MGDQVIGDRGRLRVTHHCLISRPAVESQMSSPDETNN